MMMGGMGSPRPDWRDVAVRDGQLAPVTCESCGCRLEAVEATDGVAWFHFGRLAGSDARGDRPGCIDAAHDAGGHAALAA
jgi:hypothetical protein